MAILDYFRSIICTIATTTRRIKSFALTQEGMENASMEFDVETLRPSRLLLYRERAMLLKYQDAQRGTYRLKNF